jgi:hypothetical protein
LNVAITSGGGSGGTASSFSSAFPATGTAVGASDGTNMKPLSVDGSGYLEVNVKAGSGSGLSVTDEAAWTAGTSQFVPSGGVYNDSATALTSGQQGTVRLTANRSMHTTTDNGALESGGNLATIATDVAPLVASSAGGYVRQDSTATIAKESGGNLASTATNTSNTATNTTNLPNIIGTASSAIPSKLVQVGGSDGTNARAIKTDTSGNVNVNVQGTVPVSGTVTANAGTGTFAVQDSAAESSLSTIATNTGNAATAANQTNGTQQTKITNGTNISDVLSNDTGYNAQPVANGTKTLTFTTSSSGAQTLLANTDCRGYSWITVIATGVGSGLGWNGQFAPNSGGTYFTTTQWHNDTVANGSPSGIGTSANMPYSTAVVSNYFQLNVTALTSGTLSGYVILSNFPHSFPAVALSSNSQVGSNTATGSAVPANAFYQGISDQSGKLTGAVSANTAAATTGNGLLGVGALGFDGTDWQYAGINASHALKVDGSAVTQPVSGTVTANAGTNLNTSALALETGGNLATAATNTTGLNNTVGTSGSATPSKGLVVQGSDGTDARTLHTDTSGNLDVNVQGTVPVSGTFWQTTQPVSLATNTPTLQSGSTTAVTQATAANLNATVVGTGTFAVQAALNAGTNAIGTVGTTSAVVNVGQKTVNTTAVQLSASSTVPTNGIIIQALSTNSASIFVGGSGVTTSTGFELVAGQAMSFTCNLNTLYIISVASTTDKVCFNVQ